MLLTNYQQLAMIIFRLSRNQIYSQINKLRWKSGIIMLLEFKRVDDTAVGNVTKMSDMQLSALLVFTRKAG